MLETRHQTEPQDSRALLDRRLAYLLLRLTLGLTIRLHGAVRVPALGAFVEGMVRQLTDTPLPAVAVRLFGLVLPFLEAAIGLLLTIVDARGARRRRGAAQHFLGPSAIFVHFSQ
jgi:hypothetical protein